ncbi:MAG: flagellar biosynthesis protein FlhF [Candidatus Magnetominusculus sp. LBB02]|nr:flagellar biosynthesis protein FlhF [Candidatus Magnetominusculus sp. LBB02]
MKIKKFQARSFAEALVMVKKELSDDAIILSTEEGDGGVEVTAAVDYDMQKAKPYNKSTDMLHKNIKMFNGRGALSDDDVASDVVTLKSSLQPKQKTSFAAGLFKKEQASDDFTREKGKKAASDNSYDGARTSPSRPQGRTQDSGYENNSGLTGMITNMASNLSTEIEHLRETIEDMRNMGFEMSLPPKKKALLSYLRERSIRDEYAILLCEKAKEVQDILPIITSHIKVKKPESDMKAVLVIGPTGVGKTTTVAKLAAHSIKEGKRTAIINYDTYRIGAVEQVRIYARILGIPLAVVSTANELKTSLLRFAETKDVIYIDTTGRNPRDSEYLDNINEICETDVPLETHLLMSANTDDEFMAEAYRYYRTVPVNYIGFTKIDEAVRYGALYNILMMYSKPLAYVTTGQKVPDDIDFAAVEGIAGLILKKECYRC